MVLLDFVFVSLSGTSLGHYGVGVDWLVGWLCSELGWLGSVW